MKDERQMDKNRIMFFTDALLAIIMTILVLDIKVPEIENASNNEFLEQLLKVLPHFFGFIISFAFIVTLWLSHHDLMESLNTATRTFVALNFCFVASTATLPFSTALASAFPNQPVAIATLACNMCVMNIFLAGTFIYCQFARINKPEIFSKKYIRFKRMLGVGGVFVFVFAFCICIL